LPSQGNSTTGAQLGAVQGNATWLQLPPSHGFVITGAQLPFSQGLPAIALALAKINTAAAATATITNTFFFIMKGIIFMPTLFIRIFGFLRLSFSFIISPNGLAVAVRWQSTSLSRFQYLSATDSKRLLWAGFWSTLVILCRANKLSTHYL